MRKGPVQNGKRQKQQTGLRNERYGVDSVYPKAERDYMQWNNIRENSGLYYQGDANDARMPEVPQIYRNYVLGSS